jgi:hypothetical protein
MNSYQRTPSFMSCKDESYGGSRASLFIAPISTISQHINQVRPPPRKKAKALKCKYYYYTADTPRQLAAHRRHCARVPGVSNVVPQTYTAAQFNRQ